MSSAGAVAERIDEALQNDVGQVGQMVSRNFLLKHVGLLSPKP